MLLEIVDQYLVQQNCVLMLQRSFPETALILFVGKSFSAVQELAVESLRLR